MNRRRNVILGVVLPGLLLALLCIDRDAGRRDAQARGSQALPTPAPSTRPQVPNLTVDSAHWMVERSRSNKPYLVSAGKSIAVDPRRFVFSDPENQSRKPNALRLLYDKSEYRINWPPPGGEACILDPSTLDVVKGLPFTGFEAGHPAFIGVGYEYINKATGKSTFREFWVASIIFH